MHIWLLIFVLFFSSCGNQENTPQVASNPTPSAPSETDTNYCEVKNIFQENCISCHSEAALNRTKNKIYQRISATDPSVRMPRDKPALSSEDILLIKTWIDQGGSADCS